MALPVLKERSEFEINNLTLTKIAICLLHEVG